MNNDYHINLDKVKEYTESLERGILLCDSPSDLVLYACVLLQRAKDILDMHIGANARNIMLEIAKHDKNGNLH